MEDKKKRPGRTERILGNVLTLLGIGTLLLYGACFLAFSGPGNSRMPGEWLLYLALGLAGVGSFLGAKAHGAEKAARYGAAYQRATERLRAEDRAKADGEHDHIPSTELGHSAKLDQLKALKEAGLLSEEEFQRKWQEQMKRQ